MIQQCADSVFLVRPAAFGFNTETAPSNRMQRRDVSLSADALERARGEFDAMVAALRSEGVSVCVVEDTREPEKPDAVFPNNWVSWHADGTVVLYPMQAANRRTERRRDIVDRVAHEAGFRIARTLDLTAHERDGRFLEGTGSLVLDHVHRVAYACRSPRTDERVLAQWCEAMGYAAEIFDAADRDGVPLYHTNVLMGIGRSFVAIGATCLADADRERVLARLAASGRDVIELTREEIEAFAGNLIELASWDEALGDSGVLVLSATARARLAPERYARLAACTDSVLPVPVPTIERLGGGSVRCMIAEVFR
ncbi:MAG: citrulline utilization hydrolase CtlX [Steroidobacteraceae bacterium]